MWFDLLFLQEVQEQFVQVQDTPQLQVPAESKNTRHVSFRNSFVYDSKSYKVIPDEILRLMKSLNKTYSWSIRKGPFFSECSSLL